MAAELPLPKKILIHGHWLVGNQKMSKSLGNGVDPNHLMDKFGVDAIRYFLIRDGGINIDPEFTIDTIHRRYKFDLAGQLGNIIMRSSSKKINPTGKIPVSPGSIQLSVEERNILSRCNRIANECDKLIESGQLNDYLAKISELISDLNKYWTIVQPWKYTKPELKEKLKTILYITYEVVRISCTLLQPVIPGKAKIVLDQMDIPNDSRFFENAVLDGVKGKRTMKNNPPLFKPLD